MDIRRATVESCVCHIRSVVERMEVVDCQLVETKDPVGKVIEKMNEKLKAKGGEPTDIEILKSIPGVGDVVLATLLGEAWDLIRH